MTPSDYSVIQNFLSQSCGIVLGDNKQYLVKNRLSSLLLKFDLASFSELVSAMQTISPMSQKLKAAVVDAMTTNETFWFRDDLQFMELKEKILPEIFAKKAGTIKVWSAACSSGQEPYTISMCAAEAGKKSGKSRSVQIIGTDISETILQEAKSAVYSELALSRGLDARTKNQFFQKTHEGYKLNAEIMQNVRFQQFNLLKPFSVLGRFDVIFCRNVLIYFSDQVKNDILTRMASSLEPGGYIFLSSTEAMPTGIKAFEPVRGGRARYFKKVL
jgi:chemotaxis protein methyltransferase CheR